MLMIPILVIVHPVPPVPIAKQKLTNVPPILATMVGLASIYSMDLFACAHPAMYKRSFSQQCPFVRRKSMNVPHYLAKTEAHVWTKSMDTPVNVATIRASIVINSTIVAIFHAKTMVLARIYPQNSNVPVSVNGVAQPAPILLEISVSIKM
jgi:hypothetical protein